MLLDNVVVVAVLFIFDFHRRQRNRSDAAAARSEIPDSESGQISMPNQSTDQASARTPCYVPMSIHEHYDSSTRRLPGFERMFYPRGWDR